MGKAADAVDGDNRRTLQDNNQNLYHGGNAKEQLENRNQRCHRRYHQDNQHRHCHTDGKAKLGKQRCNEKSERNGNQISNHHDPKGCQHIREDGSNEVPSQCCCNLCWLWQQMEGDVKGGAADLPKNQ